MSNALKIAAAMGGGSDKQSLYQIISGLGLTTNLKLCLDAGDAASYDPAVQTAKWLDTSGNGYDFYRGSSGAGDGAEPTFNGSAGGLSSAEYFSFDGGDYFVYDSANEAWMNGLNADGTIWSAFAMLYFTTIGVSRPIFHTGTYSNGDYGAGMSIAGSDALRFQVSAPGTVSNIVPTSTTQGANTWGTIGFGVTENGGAGASSYITAGGATGTFNASAAAVSANAPGSPCVIGCGNNLATFVPSGTRIACLAVWQGTALTTTNLSGIYNAIKTRFGL